MKREKLLEARHREMKLKKRVKSGGGEVRIFRRLFNLKILVTLIRQVTMMR